jgi:CheY-like chemotaxis protein
MTSMSTPYPTFLVVDDERVILDVMKEIAEKVGFQVVTCSGGRQALEHLQSHHADVAAVDLRMPDVGGMDVLRAIRDRDPDCQSCS